MNSSTIIILIIIYNLCLKDNLRCGYGQLQDSNKSPQKPDIIIIDQESTATIAAAQELNKVRKKVDVMKHYQAANP